MPLHGATNAVETVRLPASLARPPSSKAHVAADDEAAAFEPDRLHAVEPVLPVVRVGRKIQVDVLRVQGLAHHRHVRLPADGSSQVDAHASYSGRHGVEGARGALGPEQALNVGLFNTKWSIQAAKRNYVEETYGVDLAALANDAQPRAHVDDGPVQAPADLLDDAGDEEDARAARNLLELLARAVASPLAGQLPVGPGVAGPRASGRVSEVDGLVKVLCEGLAGLVRAVVGVAADEGLGEEEDVDLLGGGAAGDGGEEAEGLGRGGLGAW